MLHFDVTGNGEPRILLLHELGGSHESFLWLVPELADLGQCIAADLPGSGQSSPLDGGSLDDYADAVHDALQVQGHAPVLIAGMAVGGAIGAALAARHPESVRGLVIACMPAQVGADNESFVRDRVPVVLNGGMAAVEERSLARSYPEVVRDRDREVFQEYRLAFLSQDPVGYVDQSLALAGAGTMLAQRLGEVTTPTALVGGREDTFFPAEALYATAALVADLVEVRIIDHAGHLPHVQTPVDLAQTIRSVARRAWPQDGR